MRPLHLTILPLLGLVAMATAARAQVPAPQFRRVATGTIIIPGSSLPQPNPMMAHTNVQLFVPNGRTLGVTSPGGSYETPATLACVYGVAPKTKGCNPNTLKRVATGGSKTIAIVDAFDDPNAASDLSVYSKQYGLPAVTADTLKVVYATGTQPKQDPTGDWELEVSLDLDMAHALAPNATLLLVEAASSSLADLLVAERVAIKMVSEAGGGEVSNSWANTEFAKEGADAATFSGTNVVVFAAAGDVPGVSFPAILPDVIGVGGTTINRSNSGDYMNQSTWDKDGGGISTYVPTPAFQSKVTNIVGKFRGAPDIAAIANPQSGVWAYDTIPYYGSTLNWIITGGTSSATPLVAAIVNDAGSFAASGTAELTTLYAGLGKKTAFTDVKKGTCGNASSGKASIGYDLCTGIGTPIGLSGK